MRERERQRQRDREAQTERGWEKKGRRRERRRRTGREEIDNWLILKHGKNRGHCYVCFMLKTQKKHTERHQSLSLHEEKWSSEMTWSSFF